MHLERMRQMASQRRQQAQRLRFFDAGVWMGRPQGFPLADELPAEGLPAALADHLLTGALVSHWRGKTVSPQQGNADLCQALAGRPEKLLAVWTGLPLYPAETTGPLPGRDDLPPSVRAVRLFPRSHHFPLEAWCIGTLCEWLTERRRPLLLWHVEIDWPSLYRLARAFPRLAIIVETQTQKILYHTRPLLALMRDCPNIHVELSNFAGAGFVEYAVAEVGPERLIFGSFLPVSDPFVPMGLLLDADIPESDKALIAGDNLRRLVGT